MAGNPLYLPKSKQPFSNELFKEPTAEYRSCPLWSWNSKLNLPDLIRQIGEFKEMGMGGFHMHSRVGLDTQYMDKEFMDVVAACVQNAEDENMLACLYDEDRWPSGAAGGMVVKDHPEYKLQHLLLTPEPYGNLKEPPQPSASGRAIRSEEGFLIARYKIDIDTNGLLATMSRRLRDDEALENDENIWYAYVEPNPPSEWFNSQTYVDTFSRPAISRFLELTHEVYKAKIGGKFGKSVPSIFTDEPQFSHKTQLVEPWQKQDIFCPWSFDIAGTFKAQHGYDLLDCLPQLFWNSPVSTSTSQQGQTTHGLVRYHYHDHVCERFVDAFMDQISDWCKANGILLTGHMMKEPFLWSQTQALGEAMRCYRNLDLPGIDILCDRFEFNTAKQAISVARQNGAVGVMSEIYGVTNWTFDFEGYKGQGDWQAALGVTFRVPHLTWSSMAGEAKRDYPASIGYQSPWYKEYKYIEDHFARVNVALTRGRPVTRVGVIHPIESYWLCFGPTSQSATEQDYRDVAFNDLTLWLLKGLVDFDFISESLLPDQAQQGSQQPESSPVLRVGQCAYDVILVPNLRTIRSSTVRILQQFSDRGGKVVFCGETPTLVDANSFKAGIAETLIQSSTQAPFTKYHILQALTEYRDINIQDSNGKQTDRFLYQLRDDDTHRYLYICNTERKTGRFTNPSTVVSIKGKWSVMLLDTFRGEERKLASTVRHSEGKDWTTFDYFFDGCSSLLLRLTNGRDEDGGDRCLPLVQSYKFFQEVELSDVELSEPDVLLLDFAEYKLDGDDEWKGPQEILKIDNILRTQLKLPLKLEAYRQPWSLTPSQREPVATLNLRFQFESNFDLHEVVHLALEDAEETSIVINDVQIPSDIVGWWVDRIIKTVPIPTRTIKKGLNTIVLTKKFGLLSNLERVYLLGHSICVNLRGRTARLEPADSSANVFFGDFTHQAKHPFYAGNITYHCSFDIPTSEKGKKFALYIPRFAAPVIAVEVNGERVGLVSREPYMIELGDLSADQHSLVLVSYGNRYNAFGHIHVPPNTSPWCGPLLWRTDDSWWTSEYALVSTGILQTPRIMKEGKPQYPFWKEGPTYS